MSTPKERLANQVSKRLSQAYWPNPEKNESARRAAGDAEVGKLSMEELRVFFKYVDCGPTYCMVKEYLVQQGFNVDGLEKARHDNIDTYIITDGCKLRQKGNGKTYHLFVVYFKSHSRPPCYVLAEDSVGAVSQATCEQNTPFDKREYLSVIEVPFRIRGWGQTEF